MRVPFKLALSFFVFLFLSSSALAGGGEETWIKLNVPANDAVIFPAKDGRALTIQITQLMVKPSPRMFKSEKKVEAQVFEVTLSLKKRVKVSSGQSAGDLVFVEDGVGSRPLQMRDTAKNIGEYLFRYVDFSKYLKLKSEIVAGSDYLTRYWVEAVVPWKNMKSLVTPTMGRFFDLTRDDSVFGAPTSAEDNFFPTVYYPWVVDNGLKVKIDEKATIRAVYDRAKKVVFEVVQPIKSWEDRVSLADDTNTWDKNQKQGRAATRPLAFL